MRLFVFFSDGDDDGKAVVYFGVERGWGEGCMKVEVRVRFLREVRNVFIIVEV